MEVDAVVRAVAEAEEDAARRWCSDAVSDAGESLCALRREMGRRDGEAYELKASGLDRSAQILLLMLAERYELKALRRKGQRHDTVVLAGPETFLEEVLWPMYARQMDAVVAGHDRWLHGVLSKALPE
jgi:hypothetical protein